MQETPKRDRELGELLGAALSMLQERIGIIIGGTLFAGFVPMVGLIPAGIAVATSGLVQKSTSEIEPSAMIGLLAPLVGSITLSFALFLAIYFGLRIGWMAICLKISKGQPAPFSEFFSNFSYFLNFLMVNILVSIVVFAGFCLLIIPGVFLGIRLVFAPLLVLDQNLGPIEAMKKSWEMVEGQALKVFLSGVAVFVVNLIVSFIPFLGSIAQIFVTAYYDLLICTIYRNKKGDLVVP